MNKLFDRLLCSPFLSSRILKELEKPTNSLIGKVITKILGRRSAFLERFAVKLLNIDPDDKVLEVGHGLGLGLRDAYWRVAEGRGSIFGVDYSQAIVDRTRKLCALEIAEEKVEIFLANVFHLPFPDRFFDKVFHCNSYYFWSSLDMANKEIYRVMKPGSLLVTTLNLDDLRKLEQTGAVRNAFLTDPVDYMISLETVGFENVKMCYFPCEDNTTYQGIFAQKPELEVEISDSVAEEKLEDLRNNVKEAVRKELMLKLQKPLAAREAARDMKSELPKGMTKGENA